MNKYFSMKIDELIKHFDITSIQIDGPVDTEISNIAYDSRGVKEGFLFVCIKGLQNDGHRYISKAIGQGALAIVVEKTFFNQEIQIPLPRERKITIISVDDSRIALSKLSAAFYRFPSDRLKVIGITGTNGKTTITCLLDSIFRASNLATGILGTIAYKIKDNTYDAPRTTP
ncbi:MAG: Mur ligase domain-containing protein, partial [bacterium]